MLLSTTGIFNTQQRERLSGRISIPEWYQAACTWMIGRQFHPFLEKMQLSAHEPPKYLGLSLRKPLFGYRRALHQLKEKTLIRTHASKHQRTSILDLQQRAGNAFIFLSLDADDAGQQASHQMYQRLLQSHRPAIEMTPIEGAKDIGDLGIRPHGESFVVDAIEQVLGSLTKGKQS